MEKDLYPYTKSFSRGGTSAEGLGGGGGGGGRVIPQYFLTIPCFGHLSSLTLYLKMAQI